MRPIQLMLDFYQHGTQLCVKASVAESLCRSPLQYNPETLVVIEKYTGSWVLLAVLWRFNRKTRARVEVALDTTILPSQGVTTGEVSA